MPLMLRYGTRIYLAGLFAYLVGRVNLLVVNSYLGGVAAGEYSISLAIADGIASASDGGGAEPVSARGQGRAIGRHREGLPIAVSRLRTAVSHNHPAASPSIHLLYGPAFSDAIPIYYWMVPGDLLLLDDSVLGVSLRRSRVPTGGATSLDPGLATQLRTGVPVTRRTRQRERSGDRGERSRTR